MDWGFRHEPPHVVTAEGRARALLAEHLSGDQMETFWHHGWIEVRGRSGRTYRITAVRLFPGEVQVLGFRPFEQFCLQSVEKLPVSDVVLAIALLIRTDEAQFLARANNLGPQPAGLPLWERRRRGIDRRGMIAIGVVALLALGAGLLLRGGLVDHALLGIAFGVAGVLVSIRVRP